MLYARYERENALFERAQMYAQRKGKKNTFTEPYDDQSVLLHS